MRVHKKFSRWKGGGAPAGATLLGADTVPGAPVYTVSAPSLALPVEADNVLVHRFTDLNGWPVHRIAIGYNFKSVGTPVTLPVSVYIYDGETGRWYLMGPTTSSVVTPPALTDGQFTFFDSISVPPRAKTGSMLDLAQASSGSQELLVIVSDHAGNTAPNGEHEILIAPDLTTIGY